MAVTIAMVCHKGGVGKTTTAASLGGILSARKKKVLLVDIDAQKNLTETFCEGPFQDTIATAFVKREQLPIYTIRKNLDIVPSSDDMCYLDISRGNDVKKNFVLRELFAPVRDRYDYIIIDSPAQLDTLTANALVAADCVIIPINGDAYSVGGLNQTMELVGAVRSYYNPGIATLGVLITKYNGRRIVDRKVRDALDESLPGMRFETTIRESAALVQAPLCRKDIISYDPRSRGAEDYNAFCTEMIKRFNTIKK